MPDSSKTPIAIHIALVTSVVCIFSGMAMLLYLSYSAGLPEQPDAATGHTIPLANHGTVLYMTELQLWLSKGLTIGGLVLGARLEMDSALVAALTDQKECPQNDGDGQRNWRPRHPERRASAAHRWLQNSSHKGDRL